MAGAASAHQAAIASREQNRQQRAGRTRRTSADPQRAQQGATAAAAAAPAALASLSRLQHLADASPQVAQLRRLQALAAGRSAPVAQLAGGPEEEELVQSKFATAQLQPQLQQAARVNNTGLPDQLKSGIESLSGLSLDHVRVHYNSPQPAQLNALAYAQGSDIHLAPGQEQHLPHEAWHVVQQAQGRVRPTLQLKDGVPVNDDVGLEREADVMGSRSMALRFPEEQPNMKQTTSRIKTLAGSLNVFQLRWIDIKSTNESYWEGRQEPSQKDLADLTKRGRIRVPYQDQSKSNAPNANRTHGLFLAPSNSDPGQIGAPFPLNEPSSDQELPQQKRHQDVSWWHEGKRVQHSKRRRREQTIHGGMTARKQLQIYGLPDYHRAAWAHIQPDHATPEGQDREDRAMRHPSTEQANQQHTVREYAQTYVARNMGPVVASRHLHGQQHGRPGLFSSMEFGTTFVTGNEIRTHSDEVPFLTQQPGRYGDEVHFAQHLMIFGAKSLASGLLDEGILDENDLPDPFYVPADGADGDGISPEPKKKKLKTEKPSTEESSMDNDTKNNSDSKSGTHIRGMGRGGQGGASASTYREPQSAKGDEKSSAQGSNEQALDAKKSEKPKLVITAEGEVDKAILDSVKDEMLRVNYNPGRPVLVVTGERWTCYIRCVLHHFNKIDEYNNVMKNLEEKKINTSSGVLVGTEQEENIIAVISSVINEEFYVEATAASHGNVATSNTQYGEKVQMVLTGAHFSLLQ